ncbi:hypothetical protein [Staphylospora marina]|uniref:hypothetical protein n=1 Tax=Staphylospora marina TaxID=2490858 RepID=UPI000F5BBC9E|nr:hypothetical protein [Staphylospora marina]
MRKWSVSLAVWLINVLVLTVLFRRGLTDGSEFLPFHEVLYAALWIVSAAVVVYVTVVSYLSDWLVRKVVKQERLTAFLIHLAGGMLFPFLWGTDRQVLFLLAFSVPNAIVYWALDEWMKSRVKRWPPKRKKDDSRT